MERETNSIGDRSAFGPGTLAGGMDDRSRRGVALSAAEAGAAVAAERFRTGIDVETKTGKTDVVTAADRLAQERVVETLREHSDAPIVGEEDGQRSALPPDGPAWVVDPIDGTNNFVRGIRYFSTSVASAVDGEPVAGASVLPALGDRYTFGPDGGQRNGEPLGVSDRSDPETFTVSPTIWWARDRRGEYAATTRAVVERFGDMRRVGCAQATLAMVADGALEGVVTNVVTNSWDTLVGVGLVRAAGGVVTDIEGDRWTHDARGLVASNGEAHDAVLAAARAAEPER